MTDQPDRVKAWAADPCPGSRERAGEVVEEPVRSPAGGQARQNLSRYGRGTCPTCGRVFAVDLNSRVRSHGRRATGGAS